MTYEEAIHETKAKWEMVSIWHEDVLTRTVTVKKRFCCSNCNKQHKVATNYCPHCGAKMENAKRTKL